MQRMASLSSGERAPAVPAERLAGRFLAAYAVHMRPYLLFVSGAAAAAGVGLLADAPRGRALGVLAAFFTTYGFGQALTDCFQTDTDAISSPYRPLVRGEIARRDVLALSLAGLAAVALFLLALRPWTLAPAALSVVGLATYTPMKRRPFTGPFYNAWIVALVPIMAAAAAGGLAPAAVAALPGLLPALLAVFFAYANFVLAGYLKDVAADRATGYRTFPVVFGLGATALASHALAAAALAAGLAAILGRGGAPSLASLALFAGAAAIAARGQIRVQRRPDERASHPAIADTVRVFVLLSLAIGTASHGALAALAAAYYGLFELALARRPEESQI
jgi:4-hydroxybenzoate polyprenyltransferase